MDWKVSGNTGLTQEVNLSENNISEQITAGMAKELLTEVSEDIDSQKAYYRESMEEMRAAVYTETEANLLASQVLTEDSSEIFTELQKFRERYGDRTKSSGTENSEIWTHLDEDGFEKEYGDQIQNALQDTETLSLEHAETHLDVKQLEDRIAGVHLTLQQGSGNVGTVDIRIHAGEECTEAHFQVSGERVEGYLVGNTPEEVTKLQKVSDIFHEWIQTDTSAGWKAEKFSVVSSRDMTRMAAGEKQNAETIETQTDERQLYRLAKGFLQSVYRAQ